PEVQIRRQLARPIHLWPVALAVVALQHLGNEQLQPLLSCLASTSPCRDRLYRTIKVLPPTRQICTHILCMQSTRPVPLARTTRIIVRNKNPRHPPHHPRTNPPPADRPLPKQFCRHNTIASHSQEGNPPPPPKPHPPALRLAQRILIAHHHRRTNIR